MTIYKESKVNDNATTLSDFLSYKVTMASTSDDERQAQMTNEDRKPQAKKKNKKKRKTTIDSSQENIYRSYFESKPKTIPAAGSDEHLLFGSTHYSLFLFQYGSKHHHASSKCTRRLAAFANPRLG